MESFFSTGVEIDIFGLILQRSYDFQNHDKCMYSSCFLNTFTSALQLVQFRFTEILESFCNNMDLER